MKYDEFGNLVNSTDETDLDEVSEEELDAALEHLDDDEE